MDRITESKVIGIPTPRVDGPLKVSGAAMYSSDYHFPNLVHAWPVCATISNGTITALDVSAAEKMTGVIAVYHRGNIGPLYRVPPGEGFELLLDERRPPLEDDVIRYYGQYVAVVVAQTQEQARAAAEQVKVTYKAQKPDISKNLLKTAEKPTDKGKRGDVAKAWQTAAVKVDEVYTT